MIKDTTEKYKFGMLVDSVNADDYNFCKWYESIPGIFHI